MATDAGTGSVSSAQDERILDELAERLRGIVDIRDRKYGLTRVTYERCFIGSEAVTRMVATGMASDADDALAIGRLLADAGYLHHVLDEHDFANEPLFYRFRADEGGGKVARHADGRRKSWADLLMPEAAPVRQPMNLQPAMPERDPRLTELGQDDLDAIGVEPLDEHNACLLDHVHPRAWVDPEPRGRYDLVVIGAGAGGLVSAAGAAGVGARVALIESHLLGGDCLNVGCVPSKALLRCARAAAAVRDAGALGVRIEGKVSVDFGAVMERMRRLRASIAPIDSAERYARELGVDVYLGRARFTGPDRIEVNGRSLEFAKTIIATGGSAVIPDIPGLRDAPFLTNATVFNLTELPPRLGVIGAGPIGLELAQAFRRFGSEVTVFARGDGVLPREDPDAAALVRAALARDGVRFVAPVELRRVEPGDGPAKLVLVVADAAGEHAHRLDALLVATGRKPAVRGLGLEAAGVEFDERMGVKVSDRLETTNPDVYAVGDVATRYQFTHMSDFMARLAIRNALFLGRGRCSELLVPWATYTEPEVAHVGLYARDLEAQGIPYATFRRDFADVDRAILEGATEGFVKIHVKKDGDQILGATIVGAHAGDLISEVAVAMHGGVGLGALANVIHPYPSTADAIRQCGDAYNRTRLTPGVKRVLRGFLALRR